PTTPDLSQFWSLRHGPLSSLLVLGTSCVFEGISCSVALKEFRAGKPKDKRFKDALFESKDPTILLVLMEDIAALTGLARALLAVMRDAIAENGIWDALGSILISGVLMCVAVLIARDAHSLLIGERATSEMEHAVQAIAEDTPGVRGVTQLLTMHLGPDFIL